MGSKIEWLNQPGFIGATWNPIRAEYRNRRGWACQKAAAGCLLEGREWHEFPEVPA